CPRVGERLPPDADATADQGTTSGPPSRAVPAYDVSAAGRLRHPAVAGRAARRPAAPRPHRLPHRVVRAELRRHGRAFHERGGPVLRGIDASEAWARSRGAALPADAAVPGAPYRAGGVPRGRGRSLLHGRGAG